MNKGKERKKEGKQNADHSTQQSLIKAKNFFFSTVVWNFIPSNIMVTSHAVPLFPFTQIQLDIDFNFSV